MTLKWLLAGAPLLIAATAPAGQGLDTPTLLLMVTAVVGVVVLRGVLMRRHLRKRRPRRTETEGPNARGSVSERPIDADRDRGK
jgi:hypothetical protein